MKKTKLYLAFMLVGMLLLSCNRAKTNSEENDKKNQAEQSVDKREIWTKEQANSWYAKQPWLVGSNYNPSTAINQLEMWQKETFDPKRIDQELGWAEQIGMNTMRVYLHDLLHKQDAVGLYKRMDTFLEIADKHHIKILFVLFDSCWDPFPELGKQRAPKPFVHNSGWVQSPGQKALSDAKEYPRLEKYVKETVAHFKDDQRILGWDVWNEPDNMTGPSYEKVEIANKVDLVYNLLGKVFEWARESNPSQPLTSGVWAGDWTEANLKPIFKLQLDQSDVISFHCYDKPKDFVKRINELKRYGKPMLCTEYMARPNGSTFEGFLPIAKENKIAMINWGLVDGKSQTKFPWDSWTKKYTSAPPVWFHEVFNTDGTPYKKSETDFIKKITSEANKK
ncbi:cellulase family glycosylhydrolase [Flavobacterium sp. AED]|uniref:cellulase family glycosylhydrolase n=1 Tax=Flavobacterium sp. AED TaxID=1423323 RepID=UPI000580AEA4|nr:cellulase family glycosylhydrolase [Flavobacterium sp. AED]KIA87165.1 1,4-beta-xylanase [Flavobacterium sp. AED]